MKPSLYVINYNGERYLEASLGSAVRQEEKFSEIVVVDNASQDKSLDIISDRFPTVKVIRLSANRGPAPARNIALKEASSHRVLVIDNDVSITPGCIDHLMQALDAYSQAAIAMPRVLFSHQTDTIQYDGADAHFLGQQLLHNENLPLAAASSNIRKIGSVVTACFLVDRTRLAEDEPFDESFFIYFEDHDFGVRSRLQGREILAVPTALCLHGEGTAGLSLRRVGTYSRLRVFCIIRNRWLFILKNYAGKSILFFIPLFFVYELAQFSMVIKKGWFIEWCQAVFWVMAHMPEIRAKRRKIQAHRTKPDSELFVSGNLPFRTELTASRFEASGQRVLNVIAMGYWHLGRICRVMKSSADEQT